MQRWVVVRAFTSEQLTNPLVFGIASLWREGVGEVTVHSAVPPVILLVLILDEGRHHLRDTRQNNDGRTNLSF